MSPSSHFPPLRAAISAYENRSSAYRLAKVFLSRFGTASTCIHRQGLYAPFMVELFTAGFFGPSPERVTVPVLCVTAQKLPTSANVERGLRVFHPNCSEELCPGPRGGICPLCSGRTRFDCSGSTCVECVPVAPLRHGDAWDRTRGLLQEGITLWSLPRTGRATLVASGSTGLPRCG